MAVLEEAGLICIPVEFPLRLLGLISLAATRSKSESESESESVCLSVCLAGLVLLLDRDHSSLAALSAVGFAISQPQNSSVLQVRLSTCVLILLYRLELPRF